MNRAIFLDSGPLSLLTHRVGVVEADACRVWLASQSAAGTRFFVPEIVDYELRRELLRAGKLAAVARLNAFNAAMPGRYVPLTTIAIAPCRRTLGGRAPARLADNRSADLDVDVILAAQIMCAGFSPPGIVVATTNPAHLSRFVAADLWANI